MNPIKTTLTTIKENSSLLFLSFIGVAVLGMITFLIITSGRQIEVPPILQSYTDIPVYVGEQGRVLTQRNVNIRDSIDLDDQQRLIVGSRTVTGETNTIFINNNRITGVSHHVPLSENLTILGAESYLRSSDIVLEMRDQEHPFSQAVRIYAEQGIAIQYHPTTGTVQMIYQFEPNRHEYFLSRKTNLIPVEEVPEVVTEEENYAEFFATVEEATNATQRE